MLRIALCLALLTGAFSPVVAQPASNPAPASPASATATNPLLTLGPEVLTFPEIAQQLSVGGHKVTCSPALEQYAAYVYVKNRTWDKTRHLLEQGLQVQLRADKDNANNFTLEWDSDTRRRERAWFTRYAENLQRYLQEQVTLRAGYALLAPDNLQAQLEAVKAQMQALEAKNQTDTPRYRQLDATSSGMEDAQRIQSSVDARLGFSWAQNNLLSIADMEKLLRSGNIYHLQNIKQISDAVLAPVLANNSQPGNDGQPLHFAYATEGMSLPQRGTAFHIELKARLVETGGLGTTLMQMHIPFPQSLQDTFPGYSGENARQAGGLGNAAVQWLQSELRQTQEILADARLRETLPFQTQSGSGAVSRLVEAWSKRNGAEALMTLWPQREAVSLNLIDSKTTLSGLFDTAGAWTLHQYEGALCVQNAMAFADREQRLPTAALVQYARPATIEKAVSAPGKPAASAGLSEYNRLRAYCLAAVNCPLPFWTYPLRILRYRNVSTVVLDKCVGAMFLWEHLPDKERGMLLQQTRNNGAASGNISVPLTRFSVRDREKLMQALRGWGTEYPVVDIPGYLDALSGCTLYINVRSEGHSGLRQVTLNVSNPEESRLMIWGCQARFLWQP